MQESDGVMQKRGIGIRATFRLLILVLAVLSFLVAVNISYVNVTREEMRDADASVRSEVNYLCLQLRALDERTDAFMEDVGLSGVELEGLKEADPEAYQMLTDRVGSVLSGYTLEETGTVLIVSEGTILATDDERLPVGGDIEELLGSLMCEAIDSSLQSGEMQHVPYGGVLADSYKGQTAYVLAGVQSDRTVVIIESSDQVFADRASVIGREALVFFILLAVVFLVVDRLLVLVVARRIDKTNNALERITGGDLTVRVDNGGTREFRSLALGINKTVDALQGWIAEAESRMDAELATAKAIQEATLPRTFPPFPEIQRFDIYAMMNAARQVGGDFYDFFLVGDGCNAEQGKLAFVVADVSGKGVPAALFMMRVKALIRNYVSSGMELGEAMTEVNRQVCDGNDADMFVTAWVGVLDYGTRHVDYVNAGHNPPLLWTRNQGWRWLDQRSGLVLGLYGRPYHALSVDCQVGDTFLLYTDGVTEAFDVNENIYGEDRLLATAEENSRLHPRELLEAVRLDVAAYAEGAEQSDDITIVTLEVGVPPEATSTLEVPAKIDELTGINEFLHAELDRRLCPKRVQNQLDVVVEELFVNVCSYAYPDATEGEPGTVRVQRTYSADPPSITVDIIDNGIEFNPLAKPDAVLPDSAEDLTIGGLGILLVKKMVDAMLYERVGDTNVVTIVKKW